ncbi:MAG: hypothetical protein A2017_08725 [Lentisphaerae bacterium GWF2_44_16]|nr:MAG: hypothetical protein A2017_08725 [Lentisphaerae bacterium GWF2_44_16]
MPIQEQGKIIRNAELQDSYRKLELYAPGICAETKAGQFVHMQISGLRDRILRRPFSISDVNKDGVLTIIYKVVGAGTEVLSTQEEGSTCSLLGPLGTPFSLPGKDEIPVIVAGGYGAAATYLLAKRAESKGVMLLGARSEKDLILTKEFSDIPFELRTATEDGSTGDKCLVTDLLETIIREKSAKKLRFYGCGPHGMLMAMGKILIENGLDGELSLDHLMCCGVGACFACVVKVKADNEDGWRYARTCKEGPVFNASSIYYE